MLWWLLDQSPERQSNFPKLDRTAIFASSHWRPARDEKDENKILLKFDSQIKSKDEIVKIVDVPLISSGRIRPRPIETDVKSREEEGRQGVVRWTNANNVGNHIVNLTQFRRANFHRCTGRFMVGSLQSSWRRPYDWYHWAPHALSLISYESMGINEVSVVTYHGNELWISDIGEFKAADDKMKR